MIVAFVLLSIAAYLLGSVPAAYLAVRWSRGADIRKLGTGKSGAANVLRMASKWLAVPVAIFDIGKGALCVWVAQVIGLNAAQQVSVGIFTVIGHNWSVFLRFRGGRGVFASLGVITALSPRLGLIILVMPYTLAPFRQVSLGVFFAFASLPVFSWFLAQPLGIKERLPITIGFTILALIGLGRRVIASRTELSKSVPLGELIINRLLFDRDIADRNAWISRGQPGADPTEPPLEEPGEQT